MNTMKQDAENTEELVEQATTQAEVRLAEVDDEEDPRVDQPPAKEGVHTVGSPDA